MTDSRPMNFQELIWSRDFSLINLVRKLKPNIAKLGLTDKRFRREYMYLRTRLYDEGRATPETVQRLAEILQVDPTVVLGALAETAKRTGMNGRGRPRSASEGGNHGDASAVGTRSAGDRAVQAVHGNGGDGGFTGPGGQVVPTRSGPSGNQFIREGQNQIDAPHGREFAASVGRFQEGFLKDRVTRDIDEAFRRAVQTCAKLAPASAARSSARAALNAELDRIRA